MPAFLMMGLFPKVHVGRTTAPYFLPSLACWPFPSGLEMRRGLSSGLELCDGFVSPLSWPRCPWGLLQSTTPNPDPRASVGRDGRRPNALYTEILYC